MILSRRFGAGLDRLGVFPLRGREVGVEEQARHADDAVHRRANLVAHVGQELRLEPHRFERRIARLFELRGDLVALGDVTTDADHADNLAVPIAVRPPGRQVGPLDAVCGRGHQLVGGGLTSREDLIVPFDDPPGRVRIEEIVD